MGEFFNTQLMSRKKIPVSKEMEKMRQDYNNAMREKVNDRTVYSESAKESGITSGNGGDSPESQPDILPAQDVTRTVRPEGKRRTRKARSDKGKRHKQNHRQS